MSFCFFYNLDFASRISGNYLDHSKIYDEVRGRYRPCLGSVFAIFHDFGALSEPDPLPPSKSFFFFPRVPRQKIFYLRPQEELWELPQHRQVREIPWDRFGALPERSGTSWATLFSQHKYPVTVYPTRVHDVRAVTYATNPSATHIKMSRGGIVSYSEYSWLRVPEDNIIGKPARTRRGDPGTVTTTVLVQYV